MSLAAVTACLRCAEGTGGPSQLGQQQEAAWQRLAADCPQHLLPAQPLLLALTADSLAQPQAPSLACFGLLKLVLPVVALHAPCGKAAFN